MNSESLMYVGGAVVTFLIGIGTQRGKISELERRITITEGAVSTMHDNYVTQEHFKEIINIIRDTQRELKDDVKKVLEILSARAI